MNLGFRRARSLRRLFLPLAAILWAGGSCTPTDSTGTGPVTTLGLSPSFQITPSEIPAEPVDRIRMVAKDAESLDIVGIADETVDPTATEWAIALGIDLDGAASRDIIVEVELLADGVVQWSGRLGPIAAMGGVGGSIREVSVYRGPLDNLDVEGVTIVEPPTQLFVGGSAAVTATVELVPGSTAEPEVFWASSDEAVATVSVDAEGVATITGVGLGTVTIAAVAGPAVGEAVIEVVDGPPTGYDVVWEGEVDDQWTTPGNWTTGQVPQPTEAVWIPETGTSPVLTSSTTVTGLGLSATAELTLDDVLTVQGSVDAAGPIAGTGALVLSGSDAMVQGSIAVAVTVTGGVTATGSVSLGSSLTVSGSGAELVVPAGSTLAMSGTLTLGVGSSLDVDGTVTASGECVNLGASIVGSGSHPCPPALARWISGSAGNESDWFDPANWDPGVVPGASYDVVIDPQAANPILTADVSVRSLSIDADAGLELGGFTLAVLADLDAGPGGIANGVTTLTGPTGGLSGTVDALRVEADRSLTGDLFTQGGLTVDDAALTVGGATLTVPGDLTVTGAGGVLDMTTPGGVVDVSGSAVFDGGAHAGRLTEGTLIVRGNFTVTAASATGFAATGAHAVVFDGFGPQTISLDAPGPTGQRFQNLLVSQTNGTVTLATDIVAMGAFSTVSDASVDGSDDVLSVGGSYTVGGGTSIQEVNVIGDLSSIDATIASNLRVSSTFTLPGDLAVGGTVTLDDADLVVGGNRLFVSAGDLSIIGPGAQLFMQDPADTVDVFGSVEFAGGSHAGALTEGYLRILGGGLTASGSPTAFVGSGNHEVQFLGGTQVVTMDDPGPTSQRFADFVVAGTGPVNLATDVFVMDTFDLADGDMGVDGGVAGPVLEIRGTMFIEEATFTGLPVRLVSGVDATLHQVSAFMTFQSMQGTDTQLYMELPGSGQVPTLTFFNVTFDQVLTTGVYLEARSSNGAAWRLQLDNPSPGSASPGVDFLADAVVQVIWPFP